MGGGRKVTASYLNANSRSNEAIHHLDTSPVFVYRFGNLLSRHGLLSLDHFICRSVETFLLFSQVTLEDVTSGGLCVARRDNVKKNTRDFFKKRLHQQKMLYLVNTEKSQMLVFNSKEI